MEIFNKDEKLQRGALWVQDSVMVLSWQRFWQDLYGCMSDLFIIHSDSKTEPKKLNRCDALGNLVPFIEFEKRKKYQWRSVIQLYSK